MINNKNNYNNVKNNIIANNNSKIHRAFHDSKEIKQ